MFGNDDEAGWSPQRRHTRGKVATATKPIHEAALKLTAECVAVPQYDASVQLTMANQLPSHLHWSNHQFLNNAIQCTIILSDDGL